MHATTCSIIINVCCCLLNLIFSCCSGIKIIYYVMSSSYRTSELFYQMETNCCVLLSILDVMYFKTLKPDYSQMEVICVQLFDC